MATKKEVSKIVSTAVVAKSLEKEAAPLFKKLSTITKIKNDQDCENAGVMVKELKALSKTADAKMALIINPMKESIKQTQILFKPFTDQVADVEATIKAMMVEFIDAKKTKVVALEEKVESGQVSIKSYAKKVEQLTSFTGGSKREIKVTVITNDKLIPREYLVPDMVAIGIALKAGVVIPGCKLETKTSIAI